MIRRYHVWWAIEDVFQGAKSFVKQLSLIAVDIALVNQYLLQLEIIVLQMISLLGKQLSLIAVDIALVNLIKWAILCKLMRVRPNISSFLIRWCKYARE